ncbi:LysR substrate-binding domain-containing protein [Paraburkholderia phytofirmans]|uniref:Transcriptional regulator, LysR family n=1 Tax=Paraburkholderia phytofirmans (strain DSM 17436 / LMG 22146 / PsJN) TaxID=398527 RepID=B2TBA5_PARPJ|nr:LysR substrate-binding domain-containing protein [Paraburkholderia phytofirmans]ACD20847.1 transcriptional regulator, LysR family [Paraburkholderia phytofirmans PsJN]
MRRQVNLRQVEAFKAVIERGTVSAAADALFVSQPAVSKLLANLEDDCDLKLFERVRGKLAPTRHGMRLYAEIDRVFSGLRQVEHAIASIHRDDQKQLTVGVLQALSGSFINRVVKSFLRIHPDVMITIHTRDSPFLAEWLSTQQIDVGLISSIVDNPYIERDTLIEHPLICVLPPGHHLCSKPVIDISDLNEEDFITFPESTLTRQRVDALFEQNAVRPRIVMQASTAPTICEAVAAGIGVSLVHPLFTDGVKERLVLRRFTPSTPFSFQLCRNRSSNNVQLVDDFLREAKRVSDETSKELMMGS